MTGSFIKNFLSPYKSIFNKILHSISSIIYKKKDLWVFIGWHRHKNGEVFADNTKYLFLYTSNNIHQINSIWLAKSKQVAKLLKSQGYKSIYEKSLLGIWYALRAEKTIIDAYIQPENFRWAGGSKIVQLLHGRGMKKGGYADPQPCIQNFIFVSSNMTKNMLSESFTRKSLIHITGYPRNDIFTEQIRGAEIHIDLHAQATLLEARKSKIKTILYAPTFRRGEKYYDIENRLSFKELNSWLIEKDFYLAISLHPKYRNQKRSEDYQRIIFIEESDIYPILSLFDMFITDYSSLFADILLLNKPIIFFPYDLREYSENEGIYFDYESNTPGPKVYNLHELMQAIEKLFSIDNWQIERRKSMEAYHAYNDSNASKRITEILLQDTFRK